MRGASLNEILFLWLCAKVRLANETWVMVAITAGLILVTGVFAFKKPSKRHDTKFRELSIISIFNLSCRGFNFANGNFQSNQSNNDQFRASASLSGCVQKWRRW